MTLAPSERHLEDYLWAHPEALGMAGVPPQYGEDSPIYEFIFRQLRLPSGIADLIALDWRVNIFELKRKSITAQSLTQLLRYKNNMLHILKRWMSILGDDLPVSRQWLRQFDDPIYGSSVRNFLSGTLIGHEIENESLLIACAACRVDVFTYDYQGGVYTFKQIYTPEHMFDDGYREQCSTIARGDFGAKLLQYFQPDMANRHAQSVIEHNDSFDAGDAAQSHVETLEGDA